MKEVKKSLKRSVLMTEFGSFLFLSGFKIIVKCHFLKNKLFGSIARKKHFLRSSRIVQLLNFFKCH